MPDQPATLAAALAQLQGQLPRIVKKSTGQVGTRTYKYGDLGDIMDAIRDLMISLGLIWVCKPDIRYDGQFVLLCSLRHVPSGEREDGYMPLPVAGGPQGTGSAITYFRRYALAAVLNIVLEDDDGRAAQDDHDAALQAWNAPARPHTRKADRHAMAMSLLNLAEPVSSTDLSRDQADQLIAALRAKKAEVTS